MQYINVEVTIPQFDYHRPLKDQIESYFTQPENADKIEVLFLIPDSYIMQWIKDEMGVELTEGVFYRYMPYEVDNGRALFVKQF